MEGIERWTHGGGAEIGVLGEDGLREIVLAPGDQPVPEPLCRVHVAAPVKERTPGEEETGRETGGDRQGGEGQQAEGRPLVVALSGKGGLTHSVDVVLHVVLDLLEGPRPVLGHVVGVLLQTGTSLTGRCPLKQ